MKILIIGDVNGKPGRKLVKKFLPEIQAQHKLDLVIANADNLAHGDGITLRTCRDLLSSGVDVLTNGNHVWQNKEFADVFADPELKKVCIRPANLYSEIGAGETVFGETLIINLQGNAFMSMRAKCMYRTADEILEKYKKNKKIKNIIVDLHAETTSERLLLANYLDGRVSAVVGTHTHIPTADCRILPQGTALQTDIGMCGAWGTTIIGYTFESILPREKDQIPSKFILEEKGEMIFCATMIETDAKGKAIAITPFQYTTTF